MKIKLKGGNEVFAAEGAMELMSRKSLKAKLSYAIAKTYRAVKMEAECLREAQQQPSTPEYDAFQEERLKLVKEHAVKDKRDMPIMRGGNYLLKDPDGWATVYNALKTQHPEAARQMEAHEKSVKELMKQEFEIDVHAFHFNLLPDEFEPAALGPLVDMIVGVPNDLQEEEDEPAEDEQEAEEIDRKLAGNKKRKAG